MILASLTRVNEHVQLHTVEIRYLENTPASPNTYVILHDYSTALFLQFGITIILKTIRFQIRIRALEDSTYPGAFTYVLVPGASQVRASASVSCPAGSCAMGPQLTVCDTTMLRMSSSVQSLCSEAP